MDWCVKDACANVDVVCQHLQQDVEAANRLRDKYPGRVHLVRYGQSNCFTYALAAHLTTL